MQIVCYRKCGTCVKAKKFLMAHNLEFDYREITEEQLSYEELKEIHEKSGLPIKRLLNTSGTVYRDLEMKEKVKSYSDDEILRLLSQHPMLVKRPVLLKDDLVLIGFREDEWNQLI
ncbi:Spx/MgsR family RNA polymerase-binding regulatory protein [Proteiniclasticum sp. C24MP]|uniref:Spx/MgsR family RNA polymerase-binding regulatory protein n=1 Tax=Proteiniclasticum sp. C24MP TaxID=3374101 RepID=UPI0037552965